MLPQSLPHMVATSLVRDDRRADLNPISQLIELRKKTDLLPSTLDAYVKTAPGTLM